MVTMSCAVADSVLALRPSGAVVVHRPSAIAALSGHPRLPIGAPPPGLVCHAPEGVLVTDAPVTRWINQLQQGHRDVVEKLWEAYFPKLVRLAAGKLRGMP